MTMNFASVPDRIMKRTRAAGRGGVYTPSDFLDLAVRGAVDQALSRLVKAGKLRRLARGLYDFPKFTQSSACSLLLPTTWRMPWRGRPDRSCRSMERVPQTRWALQRRCPRRAPILPMVHRAALCSASVWSTCDIHHRSTWSLPAARWHRRSGSSPRGVVRPTSHKSPHAVSRRVTRRRSRPRPFWRRHGCGRRLSRSPTQ